MRRSYEIINVELCNANNVEEREVKVTLENGSEITIVACEESFEQYGGTIDELYSTIDIAMEVVDWLHGGDEPNLKF